MQTRMIVRFVLVLAISLCAGCVKNQLLRLEAKDFSAQAVEATTSGKALYVDVVQANQQMHTLLYVLDNRCVPPSFRTNETKDEPTPGPAPGVKDFCLKLRNDLTYDSFELEFRSLNFASSYVSALAEASADPKLGAALAFTQAAADFKTLQGAANNKGIDDDNVKAISDFLNAVEVLAKDKQSADEIRSLYKKNGEEVTAKLDFLSTAMIAAQADATFDDTASNEIRKLVVSGENSKLDSATRHQLLESIHQYELDTWERKREIADCKASPKVKEDNLGKFCDARAAGLIYATAQAHRELGQLIADNPNARQRERRAALAYRQFIDLVSVFVGMRGVF